MFIAFVAFIATSVAYAAWFALRWVETRLKKQSVGLFVLCLVFVVGVRRSNSTPAMVESSGIVSLEMMKIDHRAPAEKQALLVSDDDDDIDSGPTGTSSHRLVCDDQTNDAK